MTGSIFFPPRVDASGSRYHDDYGGQNVAFSLKVNSHSLILFRDYYKSLILSNVGKLIEETRSSSFVYVLNKT